MAVAGFTNLGNTEANSLYYEAEVAEAAQLTARTKLAAYYATPTPARWICVGSRMAEDGSEIKAGEITAAFAGHAPKAFRALDRKGREVETDEIATNVRDPDRKAATDVTISQPKGVSALIRCAELAGERDLVRMLRQAQSEVIDDVVRHAAEIGLVRTRRGHGGRESEKPADFLVAAVPHSKSRAGDPQEHVHLLFFNGCLRQDGTTGTLDLSNLVSHKFYLQALAGAAMAKRLQDVGFAVTPTGRGQWEVAGAPEALLKAWSKRRQEVLKGLTGIAGDLARRQATEESAAEKGVQAETLEGDLATLGRGGTKSRREAKQASSLKSRRGKDEMASEAELAAEHLKEIAAVKAADGKTDMTPQGVVAAMRAAALATPVVEGRPAEAGIEHLFERTSVATLRQFRTAVAEAAAIRGMAVSDVEAEVQRALATGAVKAIGTTERGEAVLSTDAAIEKEFSMLVAAREGKGQGFLTTEAAERAIARIEARERAAGKKNFSFAEEQRDFVRWFARGDAVVVGEGLAGTGKTTAMQAVVETAHDLGMRTVATAPTNSAAETLRKEANTGEHLSLQKLAFEIESGRRTLTSRDYILVDEAGMAELGHVATVIRAARKTGAQVALVGDERQFAPIGAGSPFTALSAVLGSSRLNEIRRQRVAWQNAASRSMAAGDTDAGIMAYAAEGRWVFGRDREAAGDRLIADWTADLSRKAGSGGEPATRMIIAKLHEDAHALNAKARRVLIDTDRLGAEEVTVRTLHRNGREGDVRDLALRAGDQLVVWRKVPEHNLNNGDRITITGFDRVPGSNSGDVMLRWRTEKTGIETTAPLSSLIPPPAPDDPPSLPRVPFLQHAYAGTQYSSQGRTVDRAFVYGGTGLDMRSVYVALTRHRDDAAVYWDREGIAQELREEGQSATRANIVEYIRREARRMDEKCNVLDFARDVDAWLATGDLNAEKARPNAVAARMEAAERNAETTVRAALADPAMAQAVLREAAQPRTEAPERPRRTPPEKRAAGAYEREVRRARDAASARDRIGLKRLDPIIAALKREGAGGSIIAGLRDAPRRVRDDLREKAARAIPAVGEVLARWTQGWAARGSAAHLDARRAEIDAKGRAVAGAFAAGDAARAVAAAPDSAAWTDEWMRRARLGRYAPSAPTLDPPPAGRAAITARLPRLPGGLAERLSDRALVGLALPRLAASMAEAPSISAGAYAEALERERSALETRLVVGVVRHTGKEEGMVRAQLPDALERPESIVNDQVREGVKRLRALAEARDAVTAAIQTGRARVTAPIAALDPHAAPTGWRVELRRAQRATQDHAPRPDRESDRVVFDGARVTVQDVFSMLRARRLALGVPSGVPAPEGSAAAQIDGALNALREAVAEGRLSARAPMNANPPSDRQAWGVAFRNAAFETARMAGASAADAKRHGREADAAVQALDRSASEARRSIAARDANAPAAERAVEAAIEAMRRAEKAAQSPNDDGASRSAIRPRGGYGLGG